MKLKMIAIAAAVLSLTGVAQANIVTTGAGNQDGDLFLFAFDTVSRNWYVRDLGYTINTFLPTGVVTLSGDPLPAPGDKTPTAGLTIDKTTAANFADASFSAFVANNTAANIKWGVGAIDSSFNGTTAATSTNRTRIIVSSVNGSEVAQNSNIDLYLGSGRAGGIGQAAGNFSLSTTLTGASAEFNDSFSFGADALASLDQSASLYYFQRTRGTLGSTEIANTTKFGNSVTNFATVTLEADGDFVYTLASSEVAAVPLPAAAWMMGAGLMAFGGAARRRKAAAQA
jgi:hypothetical protein